jgi:hypothetical protein
VQSALELQQQQLLVLHEEVELDELEDDDDMLDEDDVDSSETAGLHRLQQVMANPLVGSAEEFMRQLFGSNDPEMPVFQSLSIPHLGLSIMKDLAPGYSSSELVRRTHR